MNTSDFVRLLGAIRDHLALCDLPGEIASVEAAISYTDGEQIIVHLRGGSLPTLVAGLLAWADTLNQVTVTAWRVPDGNSVHLTVRGLVADELPVQVYGGVPYNPNLFGPDLQPGGRHSIPLGVLRGWSAAGVTA